MKMSAPESHKCCSTSTICELSEIAEASDWTKAAQLVTHWDICPDSVQFVVDRAVQDQQWDLLIKMIERGVPGQLRDSLLQSALEHHHVQCTAKLIDLGVSKEYMEEGIRQQIAVSNVQFVLEVVKTVQTSILADFVLEEYKKQNQWQSSLFCQAIQLQLYDLVYCFCNHGVSHDDLKVATYWLLSEDVDCETFKNILKHLKKDERCWFKEHAMEFTMNEFLRMRSDTSKTIFLQQIPCLFHKPMNRDLFRKAIKKSLDHDCVDIFVALCRKRCQVDKDWVVKSRQTDFVAAYRSVVKERPHFIQKICKEKIAVQQWSRMSELELVFDIVAEQEAWDVLHDLPDGLGGLCDSLSELLKYCVDKIVSHPSAWEPVAQSLDKWIERNALTRSPVRCRLVKEGPWAHSVSLLKRWCMDHGHANLAFCLAIVTEDWETIETLAAPPTTLNVHHHTLWAIVKFAVINSFSSVGVALLKILPVTFEFVDSFYLLISIDQFAKECERHGLLHWALVFQCHNLTYIQEHHSLCQNHVVLGWILRKSVFRFDSRWDIAKELVSTCNDAELLIVVLQKAVKNDQGNITETLINRVDPTKCVKDGKSLLYYAIEYFEESKKIVHLCVKSGLSTFQREIQPKNETLSPLFVALDEGWAPLIELMLAAGVCAHSTLTQLRNSGRIQDKLNRAGTSGEWKRGFRCIKEAAATPCRLEHLVRLVISHSIGCQPRRPERIDMLPVPTRLKDFIHFKDVLEKEDMDKDSVSRTQLLDKLVKGEITAAQLRSSFSEK